MKNKIFLSLILCAHLCHGWEFMPHPDDYKKFNLNKDTITVCSPGRSGSTLLADIMDISKPYKLILKSHLLPPKLPWHGKIVYIYSNPDKAAESIFHVSLDHSFICDGRSTWCLHFDHVETADKAWLAKIGDTVNQTVAVNLLSYDALGTERHLKRWLRKDVSPSTEKKGTILAIKYEHLWESGTIEAIKRFCGFDYFPLPEKKERGYALEVRSDLEKDVRRRYNLGTEAKPRYEAYDKARNIWKTAEKIQYFTFKEQQ